ncbi:response regulator [Sphingomonas cavernae]|uniref:Response regulator n=1 Tax=Sphingomonas cavernae TaxID=2320861 RepID=A0A418WKE6_9SPHN|nr:response regulator [Sphingomonas cavernae]RJF90299.1 response regulator [Sphingomonas cavernae]
MKILIVEDDASKLRNIAAALTEIDGIGLDDIASLTDAAAAKRLLRERNVDLIVLDLHLPDRIDLPPTPTGGLDFMRSISSRPDFFVPTHVVAISGNSDALSTAAEDVGELWGVIRYDPTSTQWRDQLKSRVRYAQAAWRSMVGRPRETRPGDVAILTALNEELDAILRLPLEWSQFKPEGDGTRYHEATIETGNGPMRLVAATASRMGMAATAALASKMIDLYRPSYLVMAGVTGGVRGRVNLGDILIADPSYDWGSGKYEIVDGQQEFAPNPDQLRLDPDLRPDLVKASKDSTLLSAIRSSYPGTKPDHPLECHVEAVGSGAAVLSDAAIVEDIKSHNRKLHGVEMEIYGLMMAAEICAKPRPLAFSVKAVSDFADPTKADDVRPYALYASANFILRFVTDYLGAH